MRSSGSRCLARRIRGSRSRPGAFRSWPTIWWIRGRSRTSATSACARCCASRADQGHACSTHRWPTPPPRRPTVLTHRPRGQTAATCCGSAGLVDPGRCDQRSTGAISARSPCGAKIAGVRVAQRPGLSHATAAGMLENRGPRSTNLGAHPRPRPAVQYGQGHPSYGIRSRRGRALYVVRRSTRCLPDPAALGEPDMALGQGVGEHPGDPLDSTLDHGRVRLKFRDCPGDLADLSNRFIHTPEDDGRCEGPGTRCSVVGGSSNEVSSPRSSRSPSRSLVLLSRSTKNSPSGPLTLVSGPSCSEALTLSADMRLASNELDTDAMDTIGKVGGGRRAARRSRSRTCRPAAVRQLGNRSSSSSRRSSRLRARTHHPRRSASNAAPAD
jgi:hypothetical protein